MNTRMTNRQAQAIQTKQSVFDSAIALFKEKGFDAVTVDEIAKRAGTAKGTFYTYFPTKSAIIIEEFREIDDYYLKYERTLRRYETARERLLVFTRTQMRYIRDRIGLEMLKLLYSNQIMHAQTEKILIDRGRFLHTLVRDTIAFGQQNREFRTDLDADHLAECFNRSMRSVFLDYAISNAGFDLVSEGVAFCRTVALRALDPITS